MMNPKSLGKMMHDRMDMMQMMMEQMQMQAPAPSK